MLCSEMIEIERKFLTVSEAYQQAASSKTYIVQGFLNSHPERTVRVRLKDDKGFLTVKGKSSEDGTSRLEWETELPEAEAKSLLALCEAGTIEKYRYEVPYGNHLFEVDVFLGDNLGLVVAEVELSHPSEVFQKPTWLGEEVTGQPQYYNSQLTKKPYRLWSS